MLSERREKALLPFQVFPPFPLSLPFSLAEPACATAPARDVSRSGAGQGLVAGPCCAVMVPPDRLTALFAEYHGPLVRFLTRRLGDRDAAEEIAQETFMRALKQETITSERSWLFAVASNLVRDEGRRTQRQQRRLELLREREQADAVVDPEPTSMERDAERELARRALEALGERDRDALLMREEGLDYEEIARALDLSPGSVGTTLSRARRRLMDAYESLQREQDVRPA
jgi:RNA polymerase sigma-70 factor (ECF subfamily)